MFAGLKGAGGAAGGLTKGAGGKFVSTHRI
jgi:hypothetical protein